MDTAKPPPRRVVTVAVPGTENDDVTVPRALADRLRAIVHEGFDLILLDVSELIHPDSMTLAAIVQTYVSEVKAGGTLKLLHVSKRFRELLVVTKLDRVIEVVEYSDKDLPELVDPEDTAILKRPKNA
jgi:anti-anti-sigma factor